MNREEAIYRLKNTAWLGSDDDREEAEEAVVMAIKAIEDIERWRTWSHTYDNLISRQDAIDAIARDIPFITFTEDPKRTAQRIIGTVPSADRPTGECRTCGRNADNGGVHEDGRTKCPIQEHYALLLDGYCHLYEPYNCGAKMRGENDDD